MFEKRFKTIAFEESEGSRGEVLGTFSIKRRMRLHVLTLMMQRLSCRDARRPPGSS